MRVYAITKQVTNTFQYDKLYPSKADIMNLLKQ